MEEKRLEKRQGKDLWVKLDELANERNLKTFLVKGHSDDPLNEECDTLARNAAHRSENSVDEGYGLSRNADAILKACFKLKADKRDLISALNEAMMFLQTKQD